MSHDDLEIDLDAIQRRMDGALNSLKTEFASLRTGRASASIVEPIMVEAYGQMTPINQLGTVNVPEPRMVVINVWDKAMITKIENRKRRGKFMGNLSTLHELEALAESKARNFRYGPE